MNTEPAPKGNPHLAARRAEKAALLPRAAQLAAEGRSYREIAAALGIAKSTVCQWLRGRPLGRAAAQALGTPRMTAKLAARYEALYQRALREWNRSRADRQTQTVVTSEPAGGDPTTTTTVRTEPRTGNAACLGKALAALKALEGLHCRERSRREWAENLASDAAGNERLQAAEARLDAAQRAAPAGSPAIAADQQGGEAARRAPAAPIPRKENGAADITAASTEITEPVGRIANPSYGISPAREDPSHRGNNGSARPANGSTAGMPRHRRKSFLPNVLPLPGCDFAGVRRSATLPNEVFQKGGAGKGRKQAKGGRRKPVSPPAGESAPRRGSAATLRQELDQAFDDKCGLLRPIKS